MDRFLDLSDAVEGSDSRPGDSHRARRLVLLRAASALPTLVVRAAAAQPTPRVYRIGLLPTIAPPASRFPLAALLGELGFEEGRNVEIVRANADGDASRLPALASGLVASRVDLILAMSNGEARAAMQATTTIPIVFVLAVLPEQTGLVASLARPGGNVTGTTGAGPELAGKLIEIIRDALPRARRVAILLDTQFPGMGLYVNEAERAAAALGMVNTLWPCHTEDELEDSLARLAEPSRRPDALYVVPTGIITLRRGRVIEFAARQRLPAIYTIKSAVAEGGLMAYTMDEMAVMRRTVSMVDRVLKGTAPKDLPVEQPSKFGLTVNLKAARALGLTLPASFLLRANEVIE
jgi:putative tryptophan/tyrosine transport system substrate-binding protein